MAEVNKLSVPVSEEDHIRGRIDAPIILLEYGDFECPHCGRAFDVIKNLREELKDQMALVFREFPLADIHPHAEMAAEAAEAAGAQGKFWEMHDMLFKNQGSLEFDSLMEYTQALMLDTDKFKKELEAGTYMNKVRADVESGMTSGVQGTPTFFINDDIYLGPYDYNSLLEALQKCL